MIGRARASLGILAFVLLAGGCVYFPTVSDIGGTHLRTQKGRALRQGAQAHVYVEIVNTGNAPDVLVGARTSVAQRAQIVGPAGEAVPQLAIPGTTVSFLHPGGPHIVLSELTRPLTAGESIIVTLVFEKTGNLGAVTLVE